MSKSDLSPRSELHPQPLLTVQISRRAGWIALAALAVIAALIVLDIRSRDQRQPSLNSKAIEAEKPMPAPAPSQPEVRERSTPTAPEAKPSAQPASVEITSSQVNIRRESAPVEVYIQPPPASELQPTLSSMTVVPAEPLALGANGAVSLNGAGARFPNLIYTKWFSEFHKVEPEVQINYQAIGSGGDIRQVLAGTVDFGASDGPMTDEELAQSHSKILHIPTVLGAVVPIFHIPGVSGEVRFTPETLVGIFLGKIASWNHPALVRVNSQINLPDQPIIVVHRSDGNASTLVFTDYLSKVSGEWQSHVGMGTTVKWPIGLGGKGNEGVVGEVRQLQGAIGYVDLTYALQNDVAFGSVKNSSGTFVTASLDSVTEAAASVREMPADFRISITNAPGRFAYPISTFTWLLVPQHMRDSERGKVMAAFLRWMIDDGEAMTKGLGYAPLPGKVANAVRKSIQQVR